MMKSSRIESAREVSAVKSAIWFLFAMIGAEAAYLLGRMHFATYVAIMAGIVLAYAWRTR